MRAHPVPVEPTADSTSRLAASELRNALLVPYCTRVACESLGRNSCTVITEAICARGGGGVRGVWGVCPILGEAD